MAEVNGPGLWRRTPRPWHGMTPRVWWRLLARHHFRVSPGRLPMALAVSVLAPLNAAAAAVQRARCRRAVAVAALDPPPIFIIGHWRSGTTWLHELLALDPQFRCPTTYQCMAPTHFPLTESLVDRHLGFLLPERRPLDDMRLRWSLPQEDEFALLNLGALSPYEAWAFPRGAEAWEDALDPRDFPPADREQWERVLLTFLSSVAASGPGRLVLKSPPHTARVGLLAEKFPGALFIHLVRHPEAMVASFLAAWRRLASAVSLQSGERPDLDQALMTLGASLYRRFEADRAALGPGRMIDVRYEDLAADSAAQLTRLYRHFGLPDGEAAPQVVAAYRAQVGPYRPARRLLSPGLRPAVAGLWSDYAARYGYSLTPPRH